MEIKTALNNTRSVLDFRNIVLDQDNSVKAEVKLSFWGGRYIQVRGYNGTLKIDDFASRMIALIRERNFEFTHVERIIGRSISVHINQFYSISDQQVRSSCWLTRVFCFFRELPDDIKGSFKPYPWYSCSKTRWDWKENECNPYCQAFSFYNIAQYEEQLGHRPRDLESSMRCTWPFSELDSYQPPFVMNSYEAIEYVPT